MLTQIISLIWNLPTLVHVAIALAAGWYWMSRSKLPGNVPPFPCKPYPFLGHTPMLKGGPVEKIREWRQSTGDIFSIYMGPQFVVVLNNLNLIKEALVKQGDFFSHRADNYITKNLPNSTKGILGNSGPSWKEQRTVSMAILRKFGVGKNFLAEKISIEVKAYLDELSSYKGEPRDFRILTNTSVSNVICALLIGNRFEFDDPYITGMLKVLNEQVVVTANLAVLNTFPWLQHLPGDYFMAKKMLENSRQLRRFSHKFIDELQKDISNKEENFITAYTSEMEKKEKANVSTYLDEQNLLLVVTNLFVAGSETTSSTLMWALLFAIRYPEAQEKVYKEILEVIGPDRLPSMQDRPNMNYTNAYIMETQRLGSIVPLNSFTNRHSISRDPEYDYQPEANLKMKSEERKRKVNSITETIKQRYVNGEICRDNLLHLCIKTSQVGGYTIPKGTGIIPNLDAILKDKETWGDPLVFRPERFLDNDNNLIVPEAFIPFSIGRRYCMGESLAKMELFLFLTGIFQRFHIKPEDPDNLPPQKAVFGITSVPEAFKTRLEERGNQE